MDTTTTDQSGISNVPDKKWQTTAIDFSRHSEENLWSDVGLNALKYLHSIGLQDETLRKYRVGYNTTTKFEAHERWGLPNKYNLNGNLRKVWLPRGIVIPCFLDQIPQSIRIYGYLSQDQNSTSREKSYHSIKGGSPWLFGVTNLSSANLAIFTSNELDVMLLDQEAGNLVGAVSTGRTVIDLDLSEIARWGRFLMHIPKILIPYDQEHTIYWSLSTETSRAHRACLSELPNVKTFMDLKESGMDLREWVIQSINNIDCLPNKNFDAVRSSLATDTFESDPANKVCATEANNIETTESFPDEETPAYKWVTYRFDEPWFVDPKIMPETPCFCCHNDEYRQRPDGEWICNICHPPVESSQML